MYEPAKCRVTSLRNSIMWKRERTTRSPVRASSFSMVTLPTTWLVPHAVFCGLAVEQLLDLAQRVVPVRGFLRRRLLRRRLPGGGLGLLPRHQCAPFMYWV